MAVVATLVLRPSSVHAAGKVRGFRRSPEQAPSEQRDYQERELLADEETLVDEGAPLEGEQTLSHNRLSGMRNLDMTELENPPSKSSTPNDSEHANEVPIHPFTTNLLAKNFPYQLKYQTDNELSSAVSSHIASYLSNAIDQPLLELGLDCTKFEERIGPEIRWVLNCEGAAIFEDTPEEREVNEAVHGAFSATAESQFLEEMYPRYEMVREKSEWNAERGIRRRQGNKNKQTKKRKEPKKKKKDKPKIGKRPKKQQSPSKEKNDKKKLKKNKDKKGQKQKLSKPQRPPGRRSKRPPPPRRPAKKPSPNEPQKQMLLSPGRPSRPSQPNLNSRDREWLKSHNSRRKQWHTQNNRKYVPVKWSDALKKDAAVWARHLVAIDTFYHDPNRGPYGENLAMNGGADWQPTTENVLSRWVEDEANLDFPANGHLTQVLWRATEWVGCAEAQRGNTRVQVCRYARPGNCEMASYNTWMEPMLMNESPCGAICHPDDC